MHLKSLTLRGFKSFASSTTLRFEPGITCVVGANGSGKSNVVDGIAWVLGEQGAKSLRGGKMEDVIFAGTAGRPPLGRAEVTLTIDNSDNALPIEYTEVSITRRMYRSGDSDYEINGSTCRLLDIQELLSDSGIGREMHVIVGQGQLDAVLSARPEDRRGFIEEAAGVLKHRKRKEKALRKLEAMQANLTRLTDLITELRRQLTPLGKQADVARRAATVQADLRDARLRLLAEDMVTLHAGMRAELADESAVRERRAGVEAELAAALAREGELERALATDAPALAAAQETWYRLSALQERFRGTAQLAAQRARHLSADVADQRSGRDPEESEAEAKQVEVAHGELEKGLDSDRRRLVGTVEERSGLETRLLAAENALVASVRAVADRREGLARLAGQVNALRTRSAAAADEIARLGGALSEARSRATAAGAQFDVLQGQVSALDTSELGLDEVHEAAVAGYEAAARLVRDLTETEHEAERDRASWLARREALATGLRRKDGAGAVLVAADRIPGLLGSVAALLQVAPGREAAVVAALGSLADAVAVTTAADAVEVIRLLKSEDGGRAGLIIGGPLPVGEQPVGGSRPGRPQLPAGASWALDHVRAPEPLRAAVEQALDLVAVVDSLDLALAVVDSEPEVRAVTADGDLIGSRWAIGGSADAPSVIEVQAAVEDAQRELEAGEGRCERLSVDLEAARGRAQERSAEVGRALAALNESDATMSALAEQLGEVGAAARSAGDEAQRIERAVDEAEQARDRDLAGLSALEQRLRAASQQAEPAADETSTEERDHLQAAVATCRQREMEARLAVRTAEERVRALHGRAESLRRAAEQERQARVRQETGRRARARGAMVAGTVAEAAQATLQRLSGSVQTATVERDGIAESRVSREGEQLALRAVLRELTGELERLTDAVHRDEVARAEQRLRIEQLESRTAQEYGVDVDTLVAEYGPDVPVPATAPATAGSEQPQQTAYHRATQERRAARAERDLALLGKVNPLALEEFAALTERHAFLAAQLEDLKATRRDLLTVIRQVDERIHDVFAAAFADTAREFETVFATLFPGGQGKLLLTDPDDLTVTGVEIEARPPGKKVKRLSLLSGGERSLTAVALLVAIFRARPSPFYVLDEVEAALDDVNLGRLLGLIDELREASQLIVITHQKRTMEIADALYGVAMRGDGITSVISQRLRESA
ncbi:MAG: chromosome segregation protein SMC [Geodermatophilaceae bacterium]|nr:chromosome segregation protein SMC [Geodermatophilaceae bacterium]